MSRSEAIDLQAILARLEAELGSAIIVCQGARALGVAHRLSEVRRVVAGARCEVAAVASESGQTILAFQER